ncbi:MAG: zf-HC2 domain-containing protein [Actinomycetota bacterium]
MQDLGCDTARTIISARMDGEADRSELDALDQHLQGCAGCEAWASRVHDLRRTVTMRQPMPAPDLADQLVARLAVPQMGPGQWVRYALGVVAASLVILNLPLLAGLADGDHQSRHLGTFGVALGIGLLWAAWQPERAIGLVPLAGALAVTTLVAAAIDLGSGRTAAVAEASHVLELVGLGLLWYLSGGPHRLVRNRTVAPGVAQPGTL